MPQWWDPPDASSPLVEQQGESLENTIVSQATQVRDVDAELWTIELDEEAVNAWLSTRLPKWAQNRDPATPLGATVRDLHVVLEEGGIRLGLRAFADTSRAEDASDSPGRYFSLLLRPTLSPEGQIRIDFAEVAIGRLPLPTSAVVSMVTSMIGLDRMNHSEGFAALRTMIAGEPAEPILRLGKGRQIRLVELHLETGRLTLTCQTEAEQ